MTPQFLTSDEVVRIHQQQIDQHGGSPGVRDGGLLESALAQPMAGFGGTYFHADLAEMAAAYLFHLAKNHPFFDGNKRVAALAAVVFLRLNDIDIVLPQEAYYDLAYGIASGTADKAAAADFFRRHWPAGT